MKPKAAILVTAFLVAALSSSFAFAVSGTNDNVDGDLFIPFDDSGVLGAPPNGFAQTGNSTIDFDIADGPKTGWVSFFVNYVISEQELPDGKEIMIDTTRLSLTFEDLDFLPDVAGGIELTEAVTVTLIPDGPADPANPGSYTPPANLPTLKPRRCKVRPRTPLRIPSVKVANPPK